MIDEALTPDDSPPKEDASSPASSEVLQWKHDLQRSLCAMVEALPDDPPLPVADTISTIDTAPTLQDFYTSLIALEANTRKNVQKTTVALDGVAKSLRTLQVQMSQVEERSQSGASLDTKPLLALDGQVRRMLESLQSPPAPAPFGLSRHWQTAWDDVLRGTEIILKTFTQMLAGYGIRSHSPDLGESFDPASMEAVKVSTSTPTTRQRADQATVIEVIEPAYYQDKTLLRAARVHVQR